MAETKLFPMTSKPFKPIYLPKIGLKLETNFYSKTMNKVSINFSKYTNLNYTLFIKCPYCGMITTSVDRRKDRKEKLHFCSKSHANKYFGRIRSNNRLKLACKEVNNNDLKQFLNKYNNFVYSKIYEQNSEYREDLMDWWNSVCIKICANLKGQEDFFRASYIDKCIKRAVTAISKKKSKEVFYSELSMTKQIQILGDVIEERN